MLRKVAITTPKNPSPNHPSVLFGSPYSIGPSECRFLGKFHLFAFIGPAGCPRAKAFDGEISLAEKLGYHFITSCHVLGSLSDALDLSRPQMQSALASAFASLQDEYIPPLYAVFGSTQVKLTTPRIANKPTIDTVTKTLLNVKSLYDNFTGIHQPDESQE